jgi:hypothetical protein
LVLDEATALGTAATVNQVPNKLDEEGAKDDENCHEDDHDENDSRTVHITLSLCLVVHQHDKKGVQQPKKA